MMPPLYQVELRWTVPSGSVVPKAISLPMTRVPFQLSKGRANSTLSLRITRSIGTRRISIGTRPCAAPSFWQTYVRDRVPPLVRYWVLQVQELRRIVRNRCQMRRCDGVSFFILRLPSAIFGIERTPPDAVPVPQARAARSAGHYDVRNGSLADIEARPRD